MTQDIDCCWPGVYTLPVISGLGEFPASYHVSLAHYDEETDDIYVGKADNCDQAIAQIFSYLKDLPDPGCSRYADGRFKIDIMERGTVRTFTIDFGDPYLYGRIQTEN